MGYRGSGSKKAILGATFIVGLLLFFFFLLHITVSESSTSPTPTLPPDSPMKNIVELGDYNYDLVIGQSKYVLVEFYATWCPYCQTFAPEYLKFAAAVAEDDFLREKLIVAKMSNTQINKLASAFHVENYPSLYLVPPFARTGEKYTGQRIPEYIMAFVKSKVK